MAQHDYAIANQGFPAFRSDLNDALAAIVSNNSGATEPTTMFAHQLWVDTAADPSVLKIRNADNDAWITVGVLDQTGDTFILRPAAGSATVPAYSTTSDTNTGVYFPGADRVGITTGGTQRVEVDASGNVGIGDTPVGGKVNANSTRVTIAGTNAASYGAEFIAAGTNASIAIGSGGAASYVWTAENYPMIFATNNTERMRITSDGYFKASNNGTYINSTGGPHEIYSSASGGNSLYVTNSSADPYGPSFIFSAASPDNNTNYFLSCSDSTAARMRIYSDGDVWTADAGTLSSDQKLKNTITDASPKLDDVMRLRVRNFYWNEDYHPEKTDKKLIGFIAQEFEEVFPGLVTEGVIRGGNPIYEDQAVVDKEGNPVLDEDGNPKTEKVQVGETEKEYAKGIREGKLIPILVKALQEAVERIETLEAKVAALENA